MIRIPSRLADWLLWHCVYRTIDRPPDVRIGPVGDYSLLRWYLTKRRKWLGGLYLHNARRDDEDRARHDHPWPSLSLVLTDDLGEEYQVDPPHGEVRYRRFGKGELVWRSSRLAHRLFLTPGHEAWTLFLVGPDLREWGFWCPQGWRPWHRFAAKTAHGNQQTIGCGEE